MPDKLEASWSRNKVSVDTCCKCSSEVISQGPTNGVAVAASFMTTCIFESKKSHVLLRKRLQPGFDWLKQQHMASFYRAAVACPVNKHTPREYLLTIYRLKSTHDVSALLSLRKEIHISAKHIIASPTFSQIKRVASRSFLPRRCALACQASGSTCKAS